MIKVYLRQVEDWTEKYRPKSLDEVVGNKDAKNILRKWAASWNSSRPPEKKAVIIYGRPGIGKTSSAIALAKENGWIVIEMNASDARNAEKIRRIATSGALNESFGNDGSFIPSKYGRRKLIILDEADNLYERSSEVKDSSMLDKGGKKAIIDTIKKTNQPIILIANDLYELLKGSGEELRKLCIMIKFDERQIPKYEIVSLLKKICKMENLQVDVKVLEVIAERCKGDVRSAIKDLQSICIGRNRVEPSTIQSIGYRDRENTVFDVLKDIFKTKDFQAIKRGYEVANESPEDFILWVSENIPLEYLDIADLARAYDRISKADLFLGRARKKRAYNLWSYAVDLMSCGVAVSKARPYAINVRYSFPSWLREMKSSKEARDLRNSLLKKIGRFCHVSTRKANEFLDEVRKMSQGSIELACNLVKKLELDGDEMKYLLGERATEVEKLLKKEAKEDKTRKSVIEQKKLF